MRIGLIVYGLDRPLTGIGRHSLELARGLAELTPRPEVVLLGAGGLGPLEGQTPFPLIPLPGCRLLPGLLTLGNLAVPWVAGRMGLDVLHDPSGVCPFAFCVQRFGCLVTLHDVFPLSYPGYSSNLDTMIYRWWLPRLLPRVSAVLTVSEHSQRDILQHLPLHKERVRVITNGVGALFRPLPAERVKGYLQARFDLSSDYLLYVGALTQRKNLSGALEAFGLIRHRFPGLRFVLAGPHTWKGARIENTITSLGISDCVRVMGVVSDQDLLMLYNGARLFVFPSLYEGFGLPVLEAMACGTPVVTSDSSSLPEVAGDSAHLVDVQDVDAIARAIRVVLEDPLLAGEMRDKGLSQAQKFTWERTASEMLAVYQQVLGDV